MRQIKLLGGDAPEPYEGDLADSGAEFQSLASRSGAEFKHMTGDLLRDADATILVAGRKLGPYNLDFVIVGRNSQRYVVLAHGTPDGGARAGLRRTDTVKKLGFDAMQLARAQELPILVVTSHLPSAGTAAARYLRDLADDIREVIALRGDLGGRRRLLRHLHDRPAPGVLEAPWRAHADALPLADAESVLRTGG